MKVRLKYKSIDELPAELLTSLCDVPRLRAIGFNGRFAPVGTVLTVYGIEFASGNVFYRVANPPEGRYSILCLGLLFEIVDSRISRHWECRVTSAGKIVLWPASWFVEFYHDRLSDGEPTIVANFAKVKHLLEEEASSDLFTC
jgi:hypothetical protein